MSEHRARYGAHNPDETYITHSIPEHVVDLGEVQLDHPQQYVDTVLDWYASVGL